MSWFEIRLLRSSMADWVRPVLYPAAGTTTGRWLGSLVNTGIPGNIENLAAMSGAAVVAVLISVWMLGYRWTSTGAISPETVRGHVSYWPAVLVATAAFFTMGGVGVNFSYWVSENIRGLGSLFDRRHMCRFLDRIPGRNSVESLLKESASAPSAGRFPCSCSA